MSPPPPTDTALHQALIDRSLEAVRSLLEDPQVKETQLNTPVKVLIHTTSSRAEISLSAAFSTSDEPVLDTKEDTMYPIHLAVACACNGCVLALCATGECDLNATTGLQNDTPLIMATGLIQDAEVIATLCSHGADASKRRGSDGCSPLRIAIHFGLRDCIKELVAGNADVNERQTSTHRLTLLLAAITRHNEHSLDIVEMLCAGGADVDACGRDAAGNVLTPVLYAGLRNFPKIVECLVCRYNAYPDPTTPAAAKEEKLHAIATRKGYVEVAEVLLTALTQREEDADDGGDDDDGR